jgi:polysaccharide deacetylase family protein (PEP-CTERM system associated)
MKILTFDIEDWFHILDHPATKTPETWVQYESRIHRNMDLIFDMLDETQTRATFFCLGWVAEHHPDIIKRIDQLGYEIACHSNTHQLVYELTPAQFREDTRVALDRIESVIGRKVTAYRAPGFSFTKETMPWAFETLIDLGITSDSSIFPTSRAHGGYNDFPSTQPCILDIGGREIKEFPMSTIALFGSRFVYSGGGYFRFFPRQVINACLHSQEYVMTYLHPRDFDAEQPMIPDLSPVRKFKSYYGLASAKDKLIHLLKSHNFVDLATYDRSTDWANIDRYTL